MSAGQLILRGWPLRRGGMASICSRVADHPYFGDKLDAYAVMSFVLG